MDIEDAEAAIISACLSFDHGITKAREHIAPEHFSNINYRKTYQAMLKLHSENTKIDLIVLPEKLGRDCSFLPEITILLTHHGIPANIPQYARIIKDQYVGRRLKDITTNENLTVEDQIRQIGGIDSETASLETEQFFTTDGLVDVVNDLSRPRDVELFKTGIGDLDNRISGLQPGAVTAIQALYKTGKTKFLIQIMSNALKRGDGVGFLSLEMSAARVRHWFLSHLCRINSFFFHDPLNSRWADDRQIFMDRIMDAQNQLTKMPLFVNDIRRPTIDQVEIIVGNWIQKGVKLVGIDYFERMETGTEWKDEGAVTARLADMATQYNIALIYIDQLNKAAEATGDISWANSRGSTARNADADLIIQMVNESRKGRRNEIDRMSKLKLSLLGREVPSGITVQVMADLSIGEFRGAEMSYTT